MSLWRTAGFILEQGSGSLAQKSFTMGEWDCSQRRVNQGLGQRRMNQALFHHPFQNPSSAKIEFALSGETQYIPGTESSTDGMKKKERRVGGKRESSYIQISFFLSQIKEVFIRTLPHQPDKQAKII